MTERGRRNARQGRANAGRRRLANALMLLGVLLLLGAAALLLYNRMQAERADQAAQSVLPQLEAVVLEAEAAAEETTTAEAPVVSTEAPVTESAPAATETAESSMTVTIIDGEGYIGVLSIPALDLELPVMSEWSYKKLRTAPCRYTGSLETDDLVICGHNYARHFGQLKSLSGGEQVLFTDLNGETVTYQVTAVEILAPTAIEEMTESDADLTLFTCTYGGKSRVTVRCERVE